MSKIVVVLKPPVEPEPGSPLELVNAANLPSAMVGVFYSVTFLSIGGVQPHTWSKPFGSFPAGLTLTGNILSGTPSVNGNFNFPIRVTDSDSPTPDFVERNFDIAIAAQPTVLQVVPTTISHLNV